ncbi:MAG: phospholipid carrier-dependent glycosyltransferase, partial [Acidobacteria bacterium]|nr:phospholipid carrier-dependent glycosyltransferase [Acidobacteriota bacterium]
EHDEPAVPESKSTGSAPISLRLVVEDALFYAVVIVAVAFAFQGSRGVWEPDEGRYVHSALEMLRGGDWLVPRLHELVYLDKPPAIYWAVAVGIKALGANEWGIRLAHALALVGTAILVGGWLRPVLGRRGARVAAAAYGTTLLPVVAANAVTPDGLLALFTTAASVAYWRYRSTETATGRYLWATALSFSVAMGLSTKGTAALIFAGPIVLHLLWEIGPSRAVRRTELWVAALAAIGLGAAWYLIVGASVPGALEYFFDNQVAGRLWKSSYHRNAEWWKPLRVYGASVLAGSLPWSLIWVRLGWKHGAGRLRSLITADPLSRFLLLAIALPLLVLSLAKSRLELYALPVLAPIVALTVLTAWRSGLAGRWRLALVVAAVGLMALKSFAASWPADRDTRQLARELAETGVPADGCIDVLNDKVHGLSLYGFDRVSWHTTSPETYPYFEPPRMLVPELPTLADRCDGEMYFLSRLDHLQALAGTLTASGWTCAAPQSSARQATMYCRDRSSG